MRVMLPDFSNRSCSEDRLSPLAYKIMSPHCQYPLPIYLFGVMRLDRAMGLDGLCAARMAHHIQNLVIDINPHTIFFEFPVESMKMREQWGCQHFLKESVQYYVYKAGLHCNVHFSAQSYSYYEHPLDPLFYRTFMGMQFSTLTLGYRVLSSAHATVMTLGFIATHIGVAVVIERLSQRVMRSLLKASGAHLWAPMFARALPSRWTRGLKFGVAWGFMLMTGEWKKFSQKLKKISDKKVLKAFLKRSMSHYLNFFQATNISNEGIKDSLNLQYDDHARVQSWIAFIEQKFFKKSVSSYVYCKPTESIVQSSNQWINMQLAKLIDTMSASEIQWRIQSDHHEMLIYQVQKKIFQKNLKAVQRGLEPISQLCVVESRHLEDICSALQNKGWSVQPIASDCKKGWLVK